MADITDLRSTIIPRSDQLNAEQLLGGPMILTVSEVRAGGGEDQPVSIFHETFPDRPYKPCKTMRKVLILAWGPDGTKWVGKSMELYNEPSVKFGGEIVGGIRISRLSDIPKEIKVSLTATKGRKALHEIGPLKVSKQATDVLAAITAATGRDSLKKARAMAEALTDEADIALSSAAYRKKVDELKAGVVLTFEQVKARIEGADSQDALEVVREQINVLKDEEERKFLASLADERAADLGA
jgi:hypothetical protein